MYPALRELVVAVKADEMTIACGGIQAKARHVQTFYSSTHVVVHFRCLFIDL